MFDQRYCCKANKTLFYINVNRLYKAKKVMFK